MSYKQKIYKFWLGLISKHNKNKLDKYVGKVFQNRVEKEEYILKLELKNSEAWKKQRNQENGIKSRAYISILVGIILLLISVFFNIYIRKSGCTDTDTRYIVWSTILNVINIIVSIIVGMGVSTLVLDFFAYINYTRERLKEIVIDKTYINTLSDDEKTNVIFSTEQSLYFKDGKIPPTSLYANIKKKVIPLLKMNYMTDYIVHVDCSIDEENHIIRKKIHKDMEVMCVEKDGSHFKVPFSIYLTKPENIDKKELYKVPKCIFNNENITDKIGEVVPKDVNPGENPNIEDVKFNLDYTFELKRGINTIEIETETIVPIYDNTYSHSITMPCMKYSIDFTMISTGYDLIGFGFTMDKICNDCDNSKKVLYKNKYENSYKIRFEDWALPGDGCVFVINKKNS